jgi:hypothetical protein
MKTTPWTPLFLLGATLFLLSCGDGSGPPSTPTPVPSPTPPPPPPSPFEIETLITVYRSAPSPAEWSEGTTDRAEPIEILLGVDELSPGITILNNELGRQELQDAIDRILEQYNDEDFVDVFDETKEALNRFTNDADNDGWSIDGRHGEGRDWPHDGDGNDPDGWTAQIIVNVTRR